MEAGKATLFSEKPQDNSSSSDSLFISVDDQDIGDTVFITIRAEGGSVSETSIGSYENRLPISQANDLLSALTFTGDTRGMQSYLLLVMVLSENETLYILFQTQHLHWGPFWKNYRKNWR